ncbi:hypothetical protein [Amycolatopsis sp. CA-126428]|uniref:hypothetical protein n=1 Tax=Amycolatopsis sp. CA-126428 TaxID=2073158 RepID=UPI000CD224F1|nr:hypothetical protein [Amycolatopsis sp. CA-126428]
MSNTNWARRVLVTTGAALALAGGFAVQASAAQPAALQLAAASAVVPGPVPASIPVTARRTFLSSVTTAANPAWATVNVTKAGRYTVEIENLLPTVVTTTVDGVRLQPVTLGGYDKKWSQTVYLGVGKHTFDVGASSTEAAIDAYLLGTL